MLRWAQQISIIIFHLTKFQIYAITNILQDNFDFLSQILLFTSLKFGFVSCLAFSFFFFFWNNRFYENEAGMDKLVLIGDLNTNKHAHRKRTKKLLISNFQEWSCKRKASEWSNFYLLWAKLFIYAASLINKGIG